MPGVDGDKRLVLAAANELDEYFDSSQLLWRLSDRAGSLSPGSLLLALKCTKARTESENEPGLRSAVEKIDILIQMRRGIWQKRIKDEIPYRLRLWKNALEDFFDEGMLDQSIANQIRNRVMLELLKDEAFTLAPSFQTQIDQLDRRLRPFFMEEGFLWEESLRDEFDIQQFWFLYLRLGEVKS